jgi:hypothetical protein
MKYLCRMHSLRYAVPYQSRSLGLRSSCQILLPVDSEFTHVPEHRGMCRPPSAIFLREHNGPNEYMLQCRTRRARATDTVLGHLYWSRVPGTAASTRQLEHSWPMAG